MVRGTRPLHTTTDGHSKHFSRFFTQAHFSPSPPSFMLHLFYASGAIKQIWEFYDLFLIRKYLLPIPVNVLANRLMISQARYKKS